MIVSVLTFYTLASKKIVATMCLSPFFHCSDYTRQSCFTGGCFLKIKFTDLFIICIFI